MTIALLAVGAGLLALGLTRVVQRLATRLGIVDRVERAPSRKRPCPPIPLLGGFGMYVSFVICTAVLWEPLTSGYLLPKHLIGIWLAGLVVMVGGALDDWKQLRPSRQILFPIIAILMLIASGIGIESITNPFGGVISLHQWEWIGLQLQGIPYRVILWADLFTVLWLLTTSYTTKLLDGLDGLVPGVSIIGAVVIALVSFRPDVAQPETGIISLLFAAVCAGFLVLNFSPAKIYLGEGGSLWCGLMLGVLAIVSGSKIATALLILGLPLIDTVWVIIRRLCIEKRSPFQGDTLHLHFQLRALGLSDRTIAILFYILTALFGLSTLVVSRQAKVLVLVVLMILSIGLLTWLYRRVQKL